MTPAAALPELRFSLNDGGPFHALMRRLRLLTPRGMVRSWWLALLAWVPWVLGEVVIALRTGRPEPAFFDLSVHTRLLVTMPMLLFAERLVEGSCRSTIRSLAVGAFCDRAVLDGIVARGERLRDARWPEVALAVVALLGGQLAVWQITGATGLVHAADEVTRWSFSRIWYAAVALPLSQFVMFRWLWRWAIWSYMLARLATHPLRVLCTHPDQSAGLSCLARPLSGYAGFAFALGALLASAWGTRIFAGRTTVQEQLPELLAFLLAIQAVAIVPLLPFSSHLYRVRRRDLSQYGLFAIEYTRAFHQRWISPRRADDSPLGTSDIQSLNDLAGAFGVISRTRFFAFGMRPLVAIWCAAALPMLPLLSTVMTVEDVIRRIVSTILGGLPV